jgi:hypothetical protein
LQASSKNYERTSNQHGSHIHLVPSQLKLSSSRLPSHGGETGRRISRRSEEKYNSTRRRSRCPSNTFKHKTKTEKQPNRSQFCTQQYLLRFESLLLYQTHNKVISQKDEQIQNDQKRRKNTRSKSTAFEFRNICKHETEMLHREKSVCNIDLNMKQTNIDSKPVPGKNVRRIKTFLSKSGKDHLESEDKVSASSKYFKYVNFAF